MMQMLDKIKKFLNNLFHKTTPTTPAEPPVEIEETNTRRKEDHSAETELALFMDKFLYERFPTGSAFSSIRRVHEKVEQLNGVDVEFIGTDGRVYCVDEKAQLHYLNKSLPTFAFELLSYQKGYDTVGWLCNDKLKTDLYMLIWPYAVQDDYQGITWEQFTKADCLLIQKRMVLKMLASKGLTIERMLSDARSIRASGRKGKIPIPGVKGVYYFASYPRKYQEAPINIVVSKSILKELAQRHYVVTHERVVVE
jgi:hypothetical protein